MHGCSKTFRKVVKKKTTENYKGAPYITTFLCTSLWTFYGVLKPGGFLIATVNGAGSVFHCIYILLFLIYAPRDNKVKMASLVGILDVGFVAVVISATLFVLRGSIQLTVLGILCSGLTVIMYASPLLAMKTVIKTKSVKYMPFLLSFFMFLNAAVWGIYSFLVKDIYIGIPNAIGFGLGSAQLIVYAMYKNKKGETKSAKGLVTVVEADMDTDAVIVDKYKYKNNNNNIGEEDSVKGLKRVKSLPEPSMNGPESIDVRTLFKALSFGEHRLPDPQHHNSNDIEMGFGTGGRTAANYPSL
ncbi:hypothetical protein L6164_010479 [Bauhinia variegata]|uniref:Uncharacterized protein n=1 Tax=Bauhinia variegata TaxID=167791 RepID=A0ACB9PNB9_BAUVA|nr:hypothetical protein L6164_010479 [Bauhinia variegata]